MASSSSASGSDQPAPLPELSAAERESYISTGQGLVQSLLKLVDPARVEVDWRVSTRAEEDVVIYRATKTNALAGNSSAVAIRASTHVEGSLLEMAGTGIMHKSERMQELMHTFDPMFVNGAVLAIVTPECVLLL